MGREEGGKRGGLVRRGPGQGWKVGGTTRQHSSALPWIQSQQAVQALAHGDAGCRAAARASGAPSPCRDGCPLGTGRTRRRACTALAGSRAGPAGSQVKAGWGRRVLALTVSTRLWRNIPRLTPRTATSHRRMLARQRVRWRCGQPCTQLLLRLSWASSPVTLVLYRPPCTGGGCPGCAQSARSRAGYCAPAAHRPARGRNGQGDEAG